MVGGPVLRDIAMPMEPSQWPLAPGWWVIALLAAFALCGSAAWLSRRLGRHRRRRRLQRFFDAELAQATSGAERLARASGCLRRAARVAVPQQAGVTGMRWLEVLDGDDPARPFSEGPGRLLLHGPFQPGVGEEEVAPALGVARARFVELGMRARV